MKKILAAILAIGSIFTGTPDAAAASEVPEAPEEVVEAEVPEFSVIPGDGTYAVAPFADVSDFKFKSIPEITFIKNGFSKVNDGNGNYIIPFQDRKTSYFSGFDELFSLVNDSDSYYYVLRFNIASSTGNLVLHLFAVPKSNFQIDSYMISDDFKSTSHSHIRFSDPSGGSNRFYPSTLFSNYLSSSPSRFTINPIISISVNIYESCLSSTQQAVYFSDEALFSAVPSSIVSDLSKVTFISDISCIKFKNIDTDQIYEFLPSKSSTHTLTVNYLYSENNLAADPVTRALAPGEEYNIPSPEIEGYTPTIPLVTGTMPDEDLTIDVYYTKAFYSLTVKYQYQDGSQAAEDVTLQYPMGFTYDIPSPEIPGYTPDKPTVSGTMPGKPLEVVVTYSPTLYTLSIFYQYQNGTQAAVTHREQLAAGAAYSVLSPKITGYKPNIEEISGFMPAKDINFTVIYEPDSGGGSTGGGSGEGEGEGDGDGDDDKGGGDSGGGSSGGEWSGNDPFFPGQPDFSGYDPFDMSDVLPDWNNCPFHVRELPPYTYDPFVMPGG